MKKLMIVGAMAVVLIGAGAYFVLARGFSATITITEAQIQERVNERFPKTKSKDRIEVTLTDPKVKLEDGSDRMTLEVSYAAKLPSLMDRTPRLRRVRSAPPSPEGRVLVSGELSYAKEEGTFYFINPRIKKVNVERVPEKFASRVEGIVSNLLARQLDKTPIYKLEDDNVQHAAAKLLLKSVKVSDGKLLVEVGK